MRANSHVGVNARLFGVAITLLLLPALVLTASVYGKANHDGWPTNDCNWRKHPHGEGCGVYKSHNRNQDGPIRGTDRIDELLGGHGDDAIRGNGAGDVIWGDFWPCCQPTSQSDFLSGGDGNDYIYASHGYNGISGGSGNDVIHAHFGQGGTIYCGSGYDVLYVSHKTKPRYSAHDCERTSFGS